MEFGMSVGKLVAKTPGSPRGAKAGRLHPSDDGVFAGLVAAGIVVAAEWAIGHGLVLLPVAFVLAVLLTQRDRFGAERPGETGGPLGSATSDHRFDPDGWGEPSVRSERVGLVDGWVPARAGAPDGDGYSGKGSTRSVGRDASAPVPVSRILERDPAGPHLTLTPAFEAAWTDAMETDSTDRGAIRREVAAVACVPASRVTMRSGRRSVVARHDGSVVARWKSTAACKADVAAASILPQFDPLWNDRPVAMRFELLASLRVFLETCPACDGVVSLCQLVDDAHRPRRLVATCANCRTPICDRPVDPDLVDPQLVESGSFDAAFRSPSTD